jgi:fatty acid desaturase
MEAVLEQPAVAERAKPRIKWYRCPVPREEMKKLNQKSDLMGFLQTGGYLGLLALNGTAAVYSAYHWPWYVTVAIVLFHGTCWHFMVNGFHELIHESVFRTRWLNTFFLYIFSYLGWLNPHWFFASHMEHHKYTLHQPDDLEVVLPQKQRFWPYLRNCIVSFEGLWYQIKNQTLTACNVLTGEWTLSLFPPDQPEKRRGLVWFARSLLLLNIAILAVSIWRGWWMLPVVTTFAPFYGSWLHFFCNASQHIGLVDKTPDYRLCCRTIYLNPFVQFLYWHMNYHTEHHMFAAVPCYNLPKLHRLIRHDLPECPNGLVATWYQIIGILWRQTYEPGYQFEPKLPSPARRYDDSSAAEVGPDDDDDGDHHHNH